LTVICLAGLPGAAGSTAITSSASTSAGRHSCQFDFACAITLAPPISKTVQSNLNHIVFLSFQLDFTRLH
jgi:hypothetical protein